MAGWRIGIDLGGTKIEGILLDPAGVERARHRVPTPPHDDAAAAQAVGAVVAYLETAIEPGQGQASVGVGIPGAVSSITGPRRNVDPNGPPRPSLEAMMHEVLQRPVYIGNDANCFALSEATDGAGKGYTTVFGAILGTGVGGGIVINGRILTGPHGIAGEWGHNPLPWPRDDERPGAACYCGNSGCIETFVSGLGMAQEHLARTGEVKSAPELFLGAVKGDAKAIDSVERYYDRLARALGSIINVIDPDVVVLGGGLSNQMSIYEEVPKRWGQWAFTDKVVTRLLPPMHGDASGVRGAAWLAP